MVAHIAATTVALAVIVAVGNATEDDTFPEDRNKEALIRQLRPVLEPIDGAARVYTTVNCQRGTSSRFPRMTMQSPSPAKTGIDAIREIFAKDKQATVTTGQNGIIRIHIGQARPALLKTRIHRLHFTPSERYNIIEAEAAIENTKEVQAAVHRLELQQPVIVVSENVQEPMEGVPHLPATIHDMTMDQALDLFARTFASVIFYEECIDSKGTRFFFVDHGCIVCGPWRHTPQEARRLRVPLVK